MGYLVKCVRCDYIDYRDRKPIICPSCGSPTAKVELPFKGESITFKVPDTMDKIVDAPMTFERAEEIFESIIGKRLDKTISNDFTRSRVILMIKAYAWLLVKKQPQLWLDIHTIINGIVEILTLKIEGPKDAIRV